MYLSSIRLLKNKLVKNKQPNNRQATSLDSIQASSGDSYDFITRLIKEFCQLSVSSMKLIHSDRCSEPLAHLHYLLCFLIHCIRIIKNINEIATTDETTGIGNAFYFHYYLHHKIEIPLPKRSHDCLFLFSLKPFKMVKDFYGEPYTTTLLVAITKSVLAIVNNQDIFARRNEDEFVLIKKNLRSKKDILQFAKKLTSIVDEPFQIHHQLFKIELKIGIIPLTPSIPSPKELMQRADLALREAIMNHQTFSFYSPQFKANFHHQLQLEQQLIDSIKEERFYCVFQPQIEINKQTIYGIEALIRLQWPHQKEQISPTLFVPILERLGFASSLNILVIKKVIEKLNTLPALHQRLKVAVNISPHVQHFSAHINELITIINASHLPQNIKLELEMTEATQLDEHISPREKRLISARLKHANIFLALDDFGVKYASINRLLDYHFNTIKIDMAFTQQLGLEKDSSAQIIIESIINIAKKLGLDVIAEGVETTEQLHALKQLKCDVVQGFFFHKPLKWTELTKLLALHHIL